MSGFIIHIGAPRTCSTVLQKHLFPKAKTKLVFSKRPFHSSAISEKVMIKRSGTVSAFIKDCLNNYQSNKDFNKYEFSENLLLPLTLYSAYSENNPLKKRGDLNLWVNSKAYNFIENTHQIWLLLIVDLIIGKREYLQRKK